MTEDYCKLASGLILSTIWREDDHTRILWITMLALKDRGHCVRASIPGLAAVANLPLESVRTSLKKLTSPDPDSRSKDQEGRRLSEIDGGWLVINGEKYRNFMSKAERNEYQAKLMASRRAKAKLLAQVRNGDKKLAELGQAEAEAEAEAEYTTPPTPAPQIGAPVHPGDAPKGDVLPEKPEAKPETLPAATTVPTATAIQTPRPAIQPPLPQPPRVPPTPQPQTRPQPATIAILKQNLSSAFHRSPSDRWNYDEESLLVEISRRPNAVSEFNEIVRHRSHTPPAEARFLKGRDILSILRDWTQALDQARAANTGNRRPLTRDQQQHEALVMSKIAAQFKVKPAATL